MSASTVLFVLLGLYGFAVLSDAMPLNNQPHQQLINSPQQPFDYSRFYFGNNNLAYDKKSAQVPFAVPSSQWSLPRQLAPKFKREFPASYAAHDKRLDEQLFDDFYLNSKPNGFEWNFNRL